MSSDEIVYKYSAAKARDAHIPGVPARDLTKADVTRLQPHERRSLAASPFYTKVEAQPAAEAAKTKKEAS